MNKVVPPVTKREMRLVPAGQGETVMVGPIRVSFIGRHQQLGHDWSAAIVHVPAGEWLPMHTHRSPELFHVLSGEFLFATLDDSGAPKVVRAREGDTVVIPTMIPHTWKGGDRDGIMLNCFEADLENFFIEASVAPPTRDEANRLAAKHGMQLLGPFPEDDPAN